MTEMNLKIVEEIGEDWTIWDIITKRPPIGWREVFEKCHDEFKDLSHDVHERERVQGRFFPLRKNLFRAFQLTSLEEVRVVIIGQDPYPQPRWDGKPRAQGLSFSVSKGDQIPSSLQNIFKELQTEYPEWQMPNHGDLTSWALQGVLLLNMSLTVTPNKPNSYGEIWMQFISKVLDAIGRVNPKCIFLLWGKEAQKLRRYVNDKSVILEAAHPSGLSASRGFFGCNHFIQVNDILKNRGENMIDWQI